MDEKNKKCECGGGCGDGNGGCGCGGSGRGSGRCACGDMGMGGMPHHFLLRIIIMLAILGFVFWSGVKIGEIKSYFRGGGMMGGYGAYGYPYMMGGDDGDAVYGTGMMRGWRATTTPR